MRFRFPISRLARPMSRRPLAMAVTALGVGLLGLLGLLRFNVDSGQTLLVGSQSVAGQNYISFSNTFGSDPIVVVFTARNPSAPYLENNLERLGALEIDLAHDPRVASVLGPGSVAGSLRQAAVAEVSKVLTEYPYFVAETAYLEQVQKGNHNQQQLQQMLQQDITSAQQLLEAYVYRAAVDAHNARAAYKEQANDRIIDSREKAVDAAVAKDPIPPLFAEYLAGPGNTANQAAAQQFFTRVAAAYGDCDDTIATLLKITPSCQVFFERTLLDLPNCPAVDSGQFCEPKAQWAGVLPRPAPGADSYEILTVRLKPQYATDSAQVSAVESKITQYLAHGIGSDSYTQSLSAASLSNLKQLGPLNPTECGGAGQQNDQACYAAYNDAPFSYVIAGAPLLALGITRVMSTLLAILLPVALLVMLLLLIGVFRVGGRVLPLVAAVAATVFTVGLTLLLGIPLTPAVLAGVPVLLGLGVDYAVQLVARFHEQRTRGEDSEDALLTVLGNTGGATLVAAVATLVGLLALLVVTGVDLGPLVAVPLVAEFALVLCVGVVLAWLGALFVALPLAVWSDRRRPIEAVPSEPAANIPAGGARTLAVADNLRGVLAVAVVSALAGWVLLGRVPVQTDVQQLLAPSLPELGNIETVQAETGYTNEVDIYVRGTVVTGALDTGTGNPLSVEWQCQAASLIRSEHAGQVVQATSIGDYVIGAAASSAASGAPSCVPSASPPSPSPSLSPSPSPSHAATASPSSFRRGEAAVEDAAGSTASPSASHSPSAAASASPGASPTPHPAVAAQTPFICDLRLFPLLSRTLVMPIGADTQACPPVDEYQETFLTSDPSPIDPDAARIAIGVHSSSVADEARLVAGLQQDIAAPPAGVTAAPAGLAVLATTAYGNLVNGAYVLNIVPLVLVGIGLFVVYREPRRALLPLLPTALAAGWAPLLLLLLGRLPGSLGTTLGSFTPLTVVLGSLVVALATEFGVVLLGRFHEERRRGLDPDAAAVAALGGVGRAIRVSALTLGAGFAVLALSGLLPNSLPLIADFGLVVVLDLGLAVLAVFGVMLPAAVALERRSAVGVSPVEAPAAGTVKEEVVQRPPAGVEPAAVAPSAARRRGPGVSGRRRQGPPATDGGSPVEQVEPPPRRPGVSGRRRGRR